MSTGHTVASRAKTDDPIEKPFFGGEETCVYPRNHVLDKSHVDATWRIRLNEPCAERP